ncbi:NUDIX hydrolase [Dyadobacter luteus]|jgi:8-oxo-dGTP diphosphatase|uniref:NUDIX hydrolase n=1 Tax=Dyadobacter luteus TaxID=2259619 RepID=A0A3D8YFS7_9BACT|nr:NUDIX hydrolase [Dyadobacter luteus]REA63127.1 NUDIX hydrolase [Dyadobacter luteus]
MSLEKPVTAVENTYGNRVRVRVCGFCVMDDKILLVNHSLYPGQDFWSPPGGGVEFGETTSEALKREIREETGFIATVDSFLFLKEFVNPPLHAVELFFQFSVSGGELIKGFDPEFAPDEQIISHVKWMTLAELTSIDETARHSVFSGIDSWDVLLAKRGLL